MATFLDIGLLQHFLPLFTFLLVFVIIYAILQKIEILGKSKAVHFIAALCVAFIVLFSGATTDMINFLIPWMVVIIVFMLMLFLSMMFLGVKAEEIFEKVGGVYTFLIIMIILFIIAMTTTLGPIFTPYSEVGEQTIQSETIKTLFHPRTLGAIFILLVAVFAVSQISRKVG